jgi:RHH-type proline utilization regulon transcriptional repressor/proline dehydrogenase/delta 1-pyrroline-5-carboxylate dehydrogenase
VDWDRLDEGKYRDEAEAVAALLAAEPLGPAARAAVRDEAEALVVGARRTRVRGLVDGLLGDYPLSSPEGLALMGLAEALLRTPDAEGRDRLIAETVAAGDWSGHFAAAHRLQAKASDLGLLAAEKFGRGRLNEPVVRWAFARAMNVIGDAFVLGRTIEEALANAAREGYGLCSFDMLGEGARTEADARRYAATYAHAIDAVGAAAVGDGPARRHGVSVKLSALHPRYEATQEAVVFSQLYPRLRALAVRAADHDVGLSLDAEEADRLVVSLKLLERLCGEPALKGWRGLGLAVQAYQKRAPAVIGRAAALAREAGRPLTVRLVKGAYWDSEIKHGQIAGVSDYSVYTTRAATDLSYLVAARALIEAAPELYPQFATHNAFSLAAVRSMAAQRGVAIEHQRLHGMGEALYRAAERRYGDLNLRVYAPVGGHEDLLPYLVRRLLENGANSSFIHALLDKSIPPAKVAPDPMEAIEPGPRRHPGVPPPLAIHAPARLSARGLDLSMAAERQRLARAVMALDQVALAAGPIVDGVMRTRGTMEAAPSPADRSRIVGGVRQAEAADIDEAARLARAAQPDWDRAGGRARGLVLRAMADGLETDRDRLIALLAREAGKTLADGVAEVREAVDYCRYYAGLAEVDFDGPRRLVGPAGEADGLSLHGRGVFACISPWNFPLAIFTGQIAAALAAGNAVLAKPAEQTPLIAAEAVRRFHLSGLDPRLLALLPGPGDSIGQALVAHREVDGVAFTGGTETGWTINRALAARAGPIVPLIAETGGLNAMFVDTTALAEQVIDDVLVSAFGSAGQRCSSLRILFLPHPIADRLIEAIAGAMDGLVLGDPADPATDVGPLIDAAALDALNRHLDRLRRQAKVTHALAAPDGGFFFGPVLAEIASAGFLEREVFGPVLHVVRYDPNRLAEAAGPLAARRYGLTLGIHSRLESFAAEVQRLVPAGNAYVNRSMIGAVVGVQPFGGEGLSGTGPKAGGPHSLLRYAVERTISVNTAARGGDPALFNLT